MNFGTRGAAVAAATALILTSAACSSSGKPSSPSSSSQKGANTGKPLDADQVVATLLTDKDQPGYIWDPAEDGRTTKTTPDTVTAGGAACQSFVDAASGLTTKYGTLTEVDRILHQNDPTDPGPSSMILDTVMVLPSADKASALMADLTAGLTDCKSLTMTGESGPVATTTTAIPQLVKDGQVAYLEDSTVSSGNLKAATEIVRAGMAVTVIRLVSPSADGPASVQQALPHLADIQVARLKTAQGIS